MQRVIWIIQIPKTIMNIKIICKDKNIINVDFSILKIL